MKKIVFRFGENIPSNIVEDFNIFTDYIRNNDIILTQKKQNLKQKTLFAINKLMNVEEENITPHSNQLSYSLLNLFYHLGLTGELFCKNTESGQVKLDIADTFRAYQQLTDYEKYFFLLKALWVDADWDDLQTFKYSRLSLNYVYHVTKLISRLKPGETLQVKGSDYETLFSGWYVFLKYFSYFGFWDLIEGESLTAREYKADKIIPTAFGVAMADILCRRRKITLWNRPFQEKPESDIDYDEMMFKFLLDNINKFDGFTAKKAGELEKAMAEKKKVQESQALNEPFFKAFVSLFPEGVLRRTIT